MHFLNPSPFESDTGFFSSNPIANSLLQPSSPTNSVTSIGSFSSSFSSDSWSASSAPVSPICNSDHEDSKDFKYSMDEVNNVKNHLKMFPPPITAAQFIEKNSFKGPDGHVKRPSNNFILFRKIAHDQKNITSGLTHYNERQFSQIIGRIWKGLSKEEKSTYKDLGKKVADIHRETFPEYKYQPKRDKAAWKHYAPQIGTEQSNKKSKSKRAVKTKHANREQDHQELEIAEIDISKNIPKIQISMPVQTLTTPPPPPTSQMISHLEYDLTSNPAPVSEISGFTSYDYASLLDMDHMGLFADISTDEYGQVNFGNLIN